MVTSNTCSENKDSSEFAINKLMKNGRKNRCKSCELGIERKRRASKIDEVREKDRARNKLPERAEYCTEKNREWRQANPLKYKAHMAVANAIKKGALAKLACMECGDPEVEGHHPDYSKPLDVVWLCVAHHKQLHKEHRL